ncbi:MAG TPA: hypothetical protein H9881_04535 [Candidatus Stackebrandtia excrementipullorum]|nr:hypothetical protein [Candidatus Stackebrandtia excrementipullorum]
MTSPSSFARRWLTDPLTPALILAVGAVASLRYGPTLTWAIVGGLAGFSLSGSV